MGTIKRSKRELSWQEIAYGVIIIALIVYMIIQTAIEGRGGSTIE